jgi:spermidine synthase
MPTLTLHDGRRRFLLGIFVVSGFTGLIYESIWSQYLRLFLGHSAYAQTIVLMIFMGGMAIGAGLVAHYSPRLQRMLWGYLLVEALIGVLGLLFHRVFVAATDFSYATVIPALPGGVTIQAYKWSLAALLILPQSVLLGMTFPLISGGVIRRWPQRPGETLSTLYFTNSLGAAVGVLVSGFVLIGLVGLPGTSMTAGLLNIALALGVWLVVRRQPEPAPSAASLSQAAERGLEDPTARWLVTAAFATGAASFMYEIGWIRMLSLVLGSSTHSFELMLSAFILGLAFGGLYVRKRIERITNPEVYLGGIMLVMGACAALTLPAGNAMFDVMSWALGTFTRTPNGYVAFNTSSQFIAMLIMFPTTFCAGMTLPVLTQALMRRSLGEKAIGTIYSVNTLGAIAGVLLAIHVLMPTVGLKGVILTGAALHIALGMSRVARSGWRQPAGAVLMAISVAALGFTAVRGALDPLRVASGVYRTGRVTVWPGTAVPYLRDGKTATVTLTTIAGVVTISTNGKPDAAVQMGPGEAAPDEPTMVLLAAIPLSLHPTAARVANIGFGSGLTSHDLLASPLLERLDTVELEPRMVEAARQGFGARTHDVFEDPRSHIIFEDAKTYFAATGRTYDLIISEPSNPWVSGVSSLFSDEFYGRVVQYLQPDGYFAQWLQIYETDVRVVASIIKALSPHFGAYRIYNLDDSNILIVATRSATFPGSSAQVFQWPRLRAELDRVGVQSTADLQWRLIGDGRTLDPLFATQAAPANSDYFPYVDLNSPRLRFLNENALALPQLTLLPAPFLGLLRADEPTGPTLEPSRHSLLQRDKDVRRALAIHRAVSDGKLDDLDAGTIAWLRLVSASGDVCANLAGQKAWTTSVQAVSSMTAPYLNPSELADLWKHVKDTPCYHETTGDQRIWVDLLAAVAARDTGEIVKLGAQLLRQRAALNKDDLNYLTTVVATALLRRGETGQARILLATLWDYLDHSGQLGFPLQELLALATSGGGRTLAQARISGAGGGP